MRERQYCTFQLADLFLGLEVELVQEVLRFQRMTRVPMASPVVQGLINLRGQIITAIDLRRRFDLPKLAPEQQPLNVVVRDGEGIVSLLVDEIGDVLQLDEDQLESPPATLRGPAQGLIRGVYKLESQLLLLLDLEQAIRADLETAAATKDSGHGAV